MLFQVFNVLAVVACSSVTNLTSGVVNSRVVVAYVVLLVVNTLSVLNFENHIIVL